MFRGEEFPDFPKLNDHCSYNMTLGPSEKAISELFVTEIEQQRALYVSLMAGITSEKTSDLFYTAFNQQVRYFVVIIRITFQAGSSAQTRVLPKPFLLVPPSLEYVMTALSCLLLYWHLILQSINVRSLR